MYYLISKIWFHIQIRGAVCNSNLDIIQRFQSKTLRLMLDARWYVTNAAIHRDLEIEMVKKEIERYSEHYEERIRTRPNELATIVLNRNLVVRKLKRFKPLDSSCRNQNQRIRHQWMSTLNCILFEFFYFILLSSLSEKIFIVIVNNRL